MWYSKIVEFFLGKKVIQLKPTITVDTESRYKVRIHNLEKEALSLMDRVKNVETNNNISRSEKAAQSDLLIKRLTLVRHELEIREEVLNGFNTERV